jgi:hypothetical protein
MKTILLLLAAAAFAVSPAAAETKAEKAEKAKQAKEAQEIAKQHDNTLRALRDGLPLVLPTWSLPLYFGTHMDEHNDKKAEKTKKAKSSQAQ